MSLIDSETLMFLPVESMVTSRLKPDMVRRSRGERDPSMCRPRKRDSSEITTRGSIGAGIRRPMNGLASDWAEAMQGIRIPTKIGSNTAGTEVRLLFLKNVTIKIADEPINCS